MKPAGYRVAQVTTPDDKAQPRVLYLEPVDEAGFKCAALVIGTQAQSVKAPDQGAVLAKLPRLGKYVAPKRRKA